MEKNITEEVTKEVKINGNTILEKGDKIKVINKKIKEAISNWDEESIESARRAIKHSLYDEKDREEAEIEYKGKSAYNRGIVFESDS